MTAPLLVLHAYGDVAGGAPWRAALSAGVWPGPWLAPDLPGHGQAPPPAGGSHDAGDVALAAIGALLGVGWADRPVVVGVGASGYGAQILAAAGRARALVLVDDVLPPWPADADAAMRREYEWARALAGDAAAVGPPPEAPDPRVAHGFPPRADRQFTERLRATIVVPVTVFETPASLTPPSELDGRSAMFGGPTTTQRLAAADPSTVLAALVAQVDG